MLENSFCDYLRAGNVQLLRDYERGEIVGIKDVKLRKGMDRETVNDLLKAEGIELEFYDKVYIDATETHNWTCKCGENYKKTWKSMRHREIVRCVRCQSDIKKSYDSVKEVTLIKGMSRDEVNSIIDKWLSFEDGSYIKNSHKHKWRCKCGNIFERNWDKIKGRGSIICESCRKGIQVKYEKLEDVVLEREYKRNHINNLIGEWLEFEDDIFISADTEHNWRCTKCGEEFIKKWRDIRKSVFLGCDKCRLNIKDTYLDISDVVLRSKLNKESVNNIIYRWLLLEDDFFISGKEKHNWRCKCGKIFQRNWDNIKKHKSVSCKTCTFNGSENPKDIKEVLLSNGMLTKEVNILIKDWLTLTDEKFVDHHHNHNWKCNCGNYFRRNWAKIKNREDFICQACKDLKRDMRYKYEVEKSGEYIFIKTFPKNSRLPNGKQVTGSPHIQVKHLYCNSIYEIPAAQFICIDIRCGNCCQSYEKSFAYYIEKELKETLADYWDSERNKALNLNPFLIHRSSRTKVYLKCKNDINHGCYFMSCYAFVAGNRCSFCSESKGERRIRKWLEDNRYKFNYQQSYVDLIGVGGNPLSYDFYIPENNMLIEYQGEYHDGTVSQQTEDEFNKQKEHDDRKRKYTQNNNINLLEIWYWDYDNIEDILNKELNLDKVPVE